ncbi:MAG: CYTH domain-containing protein [Bacteroidaceae bacterium]|jgi:CYTH domain-containing protein|nr:CYTH domain-containing protein [Bacteroidaceae bacterium]
MLEIERKFIVTSDSYKALAFSSDRIAQGYICREGGNSARVRVRGDKGYITIKGPSLDGGLSRFEWEKEIPVDEALELLKLCHDGIIDKTRHLVKCGAHTFEVDEFFGDNEGLTIAEVELGDANEEFEKPDFIGEEVTGDKRYYNSRLTRFPYKSW